MKTLQEIKAEYKNEFFDDIVSLVENSDLNLKTKEQAKNLYQISKEIIELVGDRNSELDLNILKTAVRNADVAIHFFINKINSLKNSRNWDKTIELVDYVLEFYTCPNTALEMDFEECFVFSKLTNKSLLKSSTNVWWFNCQKAMCLKKQKNYNEAIYYFNESLRTYPMNFSIIEEIAHCQKIIDDYKGLEETVRLQYKFAKTRLHLAFYFINKAYLLTIKGNFKLAYCYLILALGKNDSKLIKNKANDVHELINSLNGYVEYNDLESMDQIKNVERDWDFSSNILTAYVLYYSKIITENFSKQEREKVKNLLIEIANSDFPVRLVECELNESKIISRNEYLGFEFKYPKEWKTLKALPTAPNLSGFLYEFKYKDNLIVINVDKMHSNFKQTHDSIINSLKNSGAVLINEKNTILINGFNVIINELILDNEKFVFFFVNMKNIVFMVNTRLNPDTDIYQTIHALCSSVVKINI